jgi:hypothetical protein
MTEKQTQPRRELLNAKRLLLAALRKKKRQLEDDRDIAPSEVKE